MKYLYIVTKNVSRQLQKSKLGPRFTQQIDKYLSCHDEMLPETNLQGKLFVTKLTGISGRPTFVWMTHTIDDVLVYVLRAAYNHGDYMKNVNEGTVDAWIVKNQIRSDEYEEIEEFVKNYLSEIEVVIEEKESLSGVERNFVSCQLDINHQLFEETIYETEEWINYVKNEDSDFSDFFKTAEKIENHIFEQLNSPNGWQYIVVKDKAILIYHKGKDWVLSGISEYNDDFDFSAICTLPEPIDHRRGYPYSFLEDKDEWRDMELEKKSNMVLSQQQVGIVENSNIEYPLFITGRAGSGKSTALQYLFAEIILRYVQNLKAEAGSLLPPVYLSYSENLIQDARHLSKILLEKNSCYKKAIENNGISYENDIKPKFDGMFYVFQKLVRSCIAKYNPDFLSQHFASNQHVSFARFNKLWTLRFGNIPEAAKNYSPSVSWHVIRTFIKGWSSEGYLTPQDYAGLPRSSKSVSDKTFSIIYEKVWKNWYSNQNDSWDDQDLVRYCLENNYVSEQFSAIFCDEAQDFTRIELDFILKLSSFANRKIDNIGEIKKLPFIFAGDEFQTLNPTGFSWELLRGYFTDRLCELTGLTEEKNKIGLSDPIELSENFRSTRQVVKLANHIQLLRATRFDDASKPQAPHFSKEGNPIVCLSPTDKMVFDKLKNNGVILIIPSADGESTEEFISKTPLNGMIEFENGTPQGITILNPTQAKGLEYPNVAVYGFDCLGQYENLSLKNLTKWFSNPIVDTEADIDLKYQISNAYVAVTRAGTKLFIIDTFDETSFWSFAFAHPDIKVADKIKSLNDKIMNKLSPEKRALWSEDLLGWINRGDAEDITDENIGFLKSAEQRDALEKRAESLMDADLMRQAACRHKEAGRKQDEFRCWAKAYAYEEDFMKAAEYFLKAEMHLEAVNNYWLAINKTEKDHSDCMPIIRNIARQTDNCRNLKVSLACYCCQKPNIRELKRCLDEVCTFLGENDNELSTRYAWQYALDTMVGNILPNKQFANELSIINEKRIELSNYRITLNVAKLAILAYESGAHKEAISLWEELDKSVRPAEYYRVIIDNTPYPRKLEFIEQSQGKEKNIEILAEYRKNKELALNDYQKLIVGNAVRSVHDNQEFSLFLPFLLATSATLEAGKKLIEEAIENFGMSNLNKDVLYAIVSAKQTDLKNWSQPKIRYASPLSRDLFDAISFLRKIRTTDYLQRALGNANGNISIMKDFCGGLHWARNKYYSPLLFVELGRLIEARGHQLESIHYYTNVRAFHDDPVFKREMDIRLLVNKERYAEFKDDEKVRTEADIMRFDLNIPDNAPLPPAPSLSTWDWEFLFSHALTISNEIAPEKLDKSVEAKDEKKVGSTPVVEEEISLDNLFDMPEEESIIENPKSSNTVAKANRAASKQEVEIAGYKIAWIPQKNEITIKYEHDDDDFTVKIKKGKFPVGGDFYLKDNRMYIDERDEATPFVIEIFGASQIIYVYDGEIPTGMTLSFVSPEEL